jgi:glycosyltransferase involved in cell wall biosynthesis
LNLGRAVRFLGPVAEKDLAALYAGADLFVFPSEWEGFGLPVAEAMACGVAVSCSNADALVELTGDAAALFSPVDVDSIAQTIRPLLDDRERRLELARRGTERIAHFSWAATARATLAAYRGALAPR